MAELQPSSSSPSSSLALFHPAVQRWFTATLGEPTPPQHRAWPALLGGEDALVAAPTGSGKTLAAFLAALDGLVREAEQGTLTDELRVVYVSPLKALSNDIGKNLLVPLEAISRAIDAASPIRVQVRTGDTSTKERGDTKRRPPHVLVTTPESLYVLLTSAGGRQMLQSARTLILDEIHAVCGSRRGAHLALSVERLEHLVAQQGRSLQRIGLSATQRPVDEVARFLVGAARVDPPATGDAAPTPRCAIVDEGHRRALDLDVVLPDSPLEGVMSNEVWDDVIARVGRLVEAHRTTLVFVNTRRLAERVAARLEKVLADVGGAGASVVGAHHGSMSKEKRLLAEQRLKAGELRVLVATASLELGIDVGSIDLVVQLGATKSIATLLQRVGRAGHSKHATPKGRIFPLSRDELVECTALVHAVRAGALDALTVPPGGLDVLCQQLIAACGDDEWRIDELRTLVRSAWPYRALADKDFHDALQLAAHGVTTGRGRRGAWLFLDEAAGTVRGRKGARLAALTSGGAIPDLGDYVVVEAPTNHTVGTINEDFAIESVPGDIFQLGTTSWRILRVERGVVRVENAQGQPSSLPFWLGEAPARTRELSQAISTMKQRIDAVLAAGGDQGAVEALLVDEYGASPAGAAQMAEHMCATRALLGVLPSTKTIVFERFKDELDGSQIVVHAPFGAKLTRAWGLALRKRFCRTFDFELQAAANEDAFMLSVGAVQGVDLQALPKFLTPRTARIVLEQALLDAPMFGTRFRWNATRALTMLRMRGGRRVPPGLQRIEAEDLLVSLFPEQAACLENIVGDREIPDALLVRQTMADCMSEVMDIRELESVLAAIDAGDIEVRCVDTAEPSPAAHEILSAKPYAFLDDAPLEERRVQAVQMRRRTDQVAEAAALDPAAVEAVLAEVHPPVDSLDEAHDVVLLAGWLSNDELLRVGGARMPALVDELCLSGRVVIGAGGARPVYVARERAAALVAAGVLSSSRLTPAADIDARDVVKQLVRARLEVNGPKSTGELARDVGGDARVVVDVVGELERTGDVLSGRFDERRAELVCWSRRLAVRARRRMLDRLRAEIEPVSPRDMMCFLLRWHGLDERLRGAEAVARAVARLDGCSLAAAAWEEEVLPARVAGYDPEWLDALCRSGRVAWVRLHGAASTSVFKATPVALVDRERSADLLDVRAAPIADGPASSPAAEAVRAVLAARGASFFGDLVRATRLPSTSIEDALVELAAAGEVSSDGVAGLRALIATQAERDRHRRSGDDRHSFAAAGRWTLLRRGAAAGQEAESHDDDDRAERAARRLLQRYGVVFRKLAEREVALPPWRDVLLSLRRLEARGEVRGGRFVTGFSGEQFALPAAIPALRAARASTSPPVSVPAVDPLNLTGVLFPGARVPAVLGRSVLFVDGVPELRGGTPELEAAERNSA